MKEENQIKNKDIFDTLEEARKKYWEILSERKTFHTFEYWLFENAKVDVIDEPPTEECATCRFYLSLLGIPFAGMQGRCLLNFGVPCGKCEKYEPEGKQKPSCYSCTNSLTGGDNDCICTKGWTHKDDGENCDEWEERR